MGKKAFNSSVVYNGRIDGSLHGKCLPKGGIALLADVQHCLGVRADGKLADQPGRMYSQTLGTFRRSMEAARAHGATSLVLLGDQVDDREREGDKAAAEVLECSEAGFPNCPIGYLLGNHDTKWTQTFRDARERAPVKELPGCLAWECGATSTDGGTSWVIIALDTHSTSFAEKPAWGCQVDMNGEIGCAQLGWLSRRLLAAREAGKNVVILSHVPLHPGNIMEAVSVGRCGHKAKSGSTQAVRDHEAVRKVLHNAGNVKLCVAGHDHPGAYYEDEHGIHYCTLRACLFVESPTIVGMVLHLHSNFVLVQTMEDGAEYKVDYGVAASAARQAATHQVPAAVCPSQIPRETVCSKRLSLVFDMETGDPDDVLTLLFIAAHAHVDLKAVTITNKGSRDQVALVRWLLQEVGLSGVRVGAQDWPKNIDDAPLKERFYANFGRVKTNVTDCESAAEVLRVCCDANTTLLTGGPLDNLASALSQGGFKLGRWVAQGGFAGEGVVPRHLQMDKFKGKKFNKTFNFGQNPMAAKIALASRAIGKRVCVSKNVCHRTLYDDSADGWHAAVARELQRTQTQPRHNLPVRASALRVLHGVMSNYLSHKPSGKMIHDPLALAVALDESVCRLVEVQLDTEYDAWGSRPCEGSGTWISIDYDEPKFRATLLENGFQALNGHNSQSGATAARKNDTAMPVTCSGGCDLREMQWPALDDKPQNQKTRRWKKSG